mmetsp:Transcript_20299/g.46117  ORF Transcript_20299/g.46117 Transcript_20299/m.46117 type:complete len:282 (-) Transcript_20299:66-911(-)
MLKQQRSKLGPQEEVVYLQTQCSNLEKEITRYQHLDKECQDLHEYSQLLEEEVEESNRKLQEQQQTIRKLEEMLSESQLKVNETDSLRTRLAQADAAVLERDKIIARMRSAASVVDRGITEMQMRYDEILARMADEIVASQTELQRIQEKHRYKTGSFETSRSKASARSDKLEDEGSSTTDNDSESESLSSESSLGSASAVYETSESRDKATRGAHRLIHARSCMLTSKAVHLLRICVVQGSWFEEPEGLRYMLMRHGFEQLRNRRRPNSDFSEDVASERV